MLQLAWKILLKIYLFKKEKVNVNILNYSRIYNIFENIVSQPFSSLMADSLASSQANL